MASSVRLKKVKLLPTRSRRGLHDLRVSVADEHGAGTEGVVDVLVAAYVPDLGPLAAFDDDVHVDGVAVAAARHVLRDPLEEIGLSWAL